MSTFAERDAIESLNAMLTRRDKKIESLRTRIAALERCVREADRMRGIALHPKLWKDYDAARAEVDK